MKDCSIMILFNSKKLFLHYKNTILSFAIPNLSAPIANDSSKWPPDRFPPPWKNNTPDSRDSGPFNVSIGRDVRLKVASAIPSKLRLEWKQYWVYALWMKLDTMITLYCDYRTWLSYKGTSTFFLLFFPLSFS